MTNAKLTNTLCIDEPGYAMAQKWLIRDIWMRRLQSEAWRDDRCAYETRLGWKPEPKKRVKVTLISFLP